MDLKSRRKWGFPKIGVPPNHPFLDGIFPNKNHPAIGVPQFQETLILEIRQNFLILENPISSAASGFPWDQHHAAQHCSGGFDHFDAPRADGSAPSIFRLCKDGRVGFFAKAETRNLSNTSHLWICLRRNTEILRTK